MHRLFGAYGVHLTNKGKDSYGNCIFCGDDKHFGINNETGQWNCLVCGESGNRYTFLQKVHSLCMQKTTNVLLHKLSEDRGIDVQVLKQYKVVWDGNQWLIPIYNRDGALSNIKRYQIGGKFQSTSMCAVHPLGIQNLSREGPVYVCEGEWDAMVLADLLPENCVLGIPGATTFKDSWVEHFKDRQVIFLYDNDKPGQQGKRKAIKKITGIARSIHSLKWPEGTTDKYDIRDLVSDSKDPLRFIGECLVEEQEDLLESCKTIDGLMKAFKRKLYISKALEDSIYITLATVVSTRLPGDPLWLFLVGPPGCGKTTIIEAFQSSNSYCELWSKVSATALISGLKLKDGEDASWLPYLTDKTLMIKDYTAVKSMSKQEQEALYGILRDAFDGFAKVPYGNGLVKEYDNLHFSLVAGVTETIHNDNRAVLGERFLKCNVIDEHSNVAEQVAQAVQAGFQKPDLRLEIGTFLNHYYSLPLSHFTNVDISEYTQQIIDIAQLVAILRAQVDYDGADIAYTPHPEVGTRVAKQLTKALTSLTIILGKDRPDDQCFELIHKLAMNSTNEWNRRIVSLLYERPGQICIDLSKQLSVSKATIQKRLNDMLALKIITFRKAGNESGQRGRDVFRWYLRNNTARLWRDTNVRTESTTTV